MGRVSKDSNLPCYITVFSAPNYWDQYGNKGAILNIIKDELDIVQFDSSPHPFTLRHFMNVFDWSVPFVAEKVTELLHALVHAGAEEQPGRDLSPSIRDQIVGRRKSSSDIVKLIQGRMDAAHASNRLKTKMKSLARVFGLLRSVRRDREEKLGSVCVKPLNIA
jgi:serine/threonine-protein phosphatase 2B catalytic subunit